MTQDARNRGQQASGEVVVDPSRMLIPAGAVKGFIAALIFIGSMLGTVYWKLSDKLSDQEMMQREQGVKLDMMLDLWRQTAQDIKERPSRHEFDDLRQELRQGRKD